MLKSEIMRMSDHELWDEAAIRLQELASELAEQQLSDGLPISCTACAV